MKAAVRLLVITLSVWTVGCLSFKVDPSPSPEDIAFEIMTCKRIDASGELYKPLEITSEFGPADEEIICFIRLRNIRKVVRLKWKWYGPDRKLFKETKDLIINADEDILEMISAFDRTAIPEESVNEGAWIVAVFMDRELIARKSFSVRWQGRNSPNNKDKNGASVPKISGKLQVLPILDNGKLFSIYILAVG